MQKTIRNKEEKPKARFLFNCFINVFKNKKKVTSLYECTSSLATSIMTVPISGNIKNNIPKIGVT
jgi:hypothetical protein